MGSIDFGSNYAMDDLYVGFIALALCECFEQLELVLLDALGIIELW